MSTKYRCPACGEKLHDAGLLQYECLMCDAVFDIEDLTVDDIDGDSSYIQDYDDFTDADPGL